jgi:beta-glucan synthesis-associated protein KRE6
LCLISMKFSLSPNPNEWGANLSTDVTEQDDYIHNPDPRRDRAYDRGGDIFTYRGLTNLGCLILLVICILALLYVLFVLRGRSLLILCYTRSCSAGYPIISHFTKHQQSTLGGFNLGGINASGQVSRELMSV